MTILRRLKQKFEKMIFVYHINKITGMSITTLNHIYDLSTSDIKLYVDKNGKLTIKSNEIQNESI